MDRLSNVTRLRMRRRSQLFLEHERRAGLKDIVALSGQLLGGEMKSRQMTIILIL